MANALTTIGERIVRNVVETLCDKYEAEVTAEMLLQLGLMRVEATCGTDFVVHELHEPFCHNLDCDGCSHAFIQQELHHELLRREAM